MRWYHNILTNNLHLLYCCVTHFYESKTVLMCFEVVLGNCYRKKTCIIAVITPLNRSVSSSIVRLDLE